MKKFNLNYSEIAKKLAFPVLLLIGFMLVSSSAVSAQNYLPTEDALTTVKAAYEVAEKASGPSTVVSDRLIGGKTNLQHTVNAVFFNALAVELGGTVSTKQAYNSVLTRMEAEFTNPSFQTMLLVAKNEALQLITF